MLMSRRGFIGGIGLIPLAGLHSCGSSDERFVCPPCGCAEDGTQFSQPGLCPDCGMVLKPTKQSVLGLMPQKLPSGAGVFQWQHSPDSKIVNVHYYQPKEFNQDSKILMVLPGASRNSDTYRNAWLSTAINRNILIISLGFPERDFNFADYHLAGMVDQFTFQSPTRRKVGHSDVIQLDSNTIEYEANSDRGDWLFNDIELIFDYVVGVIGAVQSKFDLFGHSAGGQIAHRYALFGASEKVDNILAANSGFYTLPDFQLRFPFGLKGLDQSQQLDCKQFTSQLTLLLGENDNAIGTGGVFLVTSETQAQGDGRLQRGEHFYRKSKAKAGELGCTFNWNLKRVPNVGHNGYEMAQAAATHWLGD